MRPNSKTLAMREISRDPALASLFGVLADQPTSAVHGDASFGNDFGGGNNGFGAEYYGYGGDFGADPTVAPVSPQAMALPVNHPAHPLHPSQAANTMAILHQHSQGVARTSQREMLLDPNKGSSTKVERYSFSVAASNDTSGNALTIGGLAGGAQPFSASTQPSVTIRPQRFVTNSPFQGVFLLSGLQVANVNAFVGDIEDAFNFGSAAVGVHLDLPTMSPANKVTMSGSLQPFTPPGFSAQPYTLTMSFSGPATIAG